MSAQLESIVRHFLDQVINGKKLDLIDEFTTPDVIDHTVPPGMPAGREGVKATLGMFFSAFPDLTYTLDDVVVDGNKVATRSTISGTHQGEFMGIPATGKRFSVSSIDIMQFKGDKVVERWAVDDNLTMLQQLGVINM
jgi:steroid delta-isomerase-like uncharacterized protein